MVLNTSIFAKEPIKKVKYGIYTIEIEKPKLKVLRQKSIAGFINLIKLTSQEKLELLEFITIKMKELASQSPHLTRLYSLHTK